MVSNQLDELGTTYIQVMPRQSFSVPGLAQRPVRLTWDDGQEIASDWCAASSDHAAHLRQRGGEVPRPPAPHHDLRRRRRVAGGQQLQRRPRAASSPISTSSGAARWWWWASTSSRSCGSPEPIGAGDLRRHHRDDDHRRHGVEGESLGRDFDDAVLMPFDSALEHLRARGGRPACSSSCWPRTRRWWSRCAKASSGCCAQRHHIAEGEPDDFRVMVQDEIREVYSSILGGITAMVGLDRRHRAPGRRHRHHEHHAGVGDRAHARDRPAQGGRRAPQGHPDPVPDRGGGAVVARRPGRR